MGNKGHASPTTEHCSTDSCICNLKAGSCQPSAGCGWSAVVSECAPRLHTWHPSSRPAHPRRRHALAALVTKAACCNGGSCCCGRCCWRAATRTSTRRRPWRRRAPRRCQYGCPRCSWHAWRRQTAVAASPPTPRAGRRAVSVGPGLPRQLVPGVRRLRPPQLLPAGWRAGSLTAAAPGHPRGGAAAVHACTAYRWMGRWAFQCVAALRARLIRHALRHALRLSQVQNTKLSIRASAMAAHLCSFGEQPPPLPLPAAPLGSQGLQPLPEAGLCMRACCAGRHGRAAFLAGGRLAKRAGGLVCAKGAVGSGPCAAGVGAGDLSWWGGCVHSH